MPSASWFFNVRFFELSILGYLEVILGCEGRQQADDKEGERYIELACTPTAVRARVRACVSDAVRLRGGIATCSLLQWDRSGDARTMRFGVAAAVHGHVLVHEPLVLSELLGQSTWHRTPSQAVVCSCTHARAHVPAGLWMGAGWVVMRGLRIGWLRS